MKDEKKYPCIVNRSGQAPREYIGIMYNGDQGVYKRATIKALKNSGASKACIDAVKAADGDLEISKILIESDQMDVLVDVFNTTDSSTAVWDYVDELYSSVADVDTEALASKLVSKAVSRLGKDANIKDVLAEVDKAIIEQTDKMLDELKERHEKNAKIVLKKFQEARKKKLQRLKEEIQAIQEEKKRLEELM